MRPSSVNNRSRDQTTYVFFFFSKINIIILFNFETFGFEVFQFSPFFFFEIDFPLFDL